MLAADLDGKRQELLPRNAPFVAAIFDELRRNVTAWRPCWLMRTARQHISKL